MCGFVVAWGSKLQPTVALSTMEAEYMALCAATREVMFISQTTFNRTFSRLEVPYIDDGRHQGLYFFCQKHYDN